MGLRESFDAVNGGFGGAPKFPQAPVLLFLLARTDTRSDSENEAESGNGRGTGGERESANGGERESKEARIALPRESKEARIALQRESKEARIALPRESKEARIALPRESEEARMALLTLRAMAGGGIHDQIGGGFHRYAVDATWTVPHFEKMLYDNALLARAYLQAHRLSGDPAFACVCRDTLDWLLRDMQGPEGGFYSALDADSLGVEGRYYVWTTSELEELLGEHADAAIRWFGATEEGNFIDPHHPHPGWNVLEDRGPRPTHSLCESIRARLLAAREQRARPGLDDKCLTSWNALAVAALADAGTGTALPPTGTTPPDTDPGPADVSIATGEPRYLQAAIRCAEFILRDLHDANGLLLRTYSHGQARLPAYLEDHAFLLEALLTLFEATCEDRWLDHARALADTLIDRFADPLHGGFFSTAADHERSACCAWRASAAHTTTNATPLARCGCCTSSHPGIPAPSATSSRRSSSTSSPRRRRRARWSLPPQTSRSVHLTRAASARSPMHPAARPSPTPRGRLAPNGRAGPLFLQSCYRTAR
jgi:uncharacterized protein YyaL (SSP411 family)